jgi:hypothetical protein
VVEPRSFISSATEARIKQLIRRGSATAKGLMDPPVTVTFTRDGQTAVATNVELIDIALDDREQVVTGVNTGAIEETTVGTANAWAEDVAGVEQDDRFSWQGRVCVVTFVAPVAYGTVDIRFRLLAGGA